MEVFRLSKRILDIVGLYQASDHLGSFNCISIIKNMIVIVCTLALLLPSIAFLILHATQFSEICDAISNITGVLIVLGGYLAMLTKKTQLNRIIFELERQIIERNLVHESFIYKETSDHVVRVCKRIFVIINGSIFLFYVMPLIKVAVDLLIGQYSRESWTLMYQVRMPYDISTPHGYAVTLATQICSCIVGGYYFSLFILLFIGFCKFAIAHAENVIESFEQFNEIFISGRNDSRAPDYNRVLRSFMFTLKHHSYAMNYWRDFSDALSGAIFIYIAMSQFCMIGLLYQFQMSSEYGLTLVFSTLMSFVDISGCIFGFCYLGDGVTEHYSRVGLSICQCKWYLFPPKIQRKLVPILIVTQRPRFISGLSLILCTIENFTTIVKAILSYYMALRTLA